MATRRTEHSVKPTDWWAGSVTPSNGRFSGDEARIDISEGYFAELATAAGLKIMKTIGNVFGQTLYILSKFA
jgi:hypothetical protein